VKPPSLASASFHAELPSSSPSADACPLPSDGLDGYLGYPAGTGWRSGLLLAVSDGLSVANRDPKPVGTKRSADRPAHQGSTRLESGERFLMYCASFEQFANTLRNRGQEFRQDADRMTGEWGWMEDRSLGVEEPVRHPQPRLETGALRGRRSGSRQRPLPPLCSFSRPRTSRPTVSPGHRRAPPS